MIDGQREIERGRWDVSYLYTTVLEVIHNTWRATHRNKVNKKQRERERKEDVRVIDIEKWIEL